MKYKVAFVCVHNSCRSQTIRDRRTLRSWCRHIPKLLLDISEDFRKRRDLVKAKIEELIMCVQNGGLAFI